MANHPDTETMTLGQMKGVIRRIDGSVPTDLSYEEAEDTINNPLMKPLLEDFWHNVRNPVELPETFAVWLGDLPRRVATNHHITVLPDYSGALDTRLEFLKTTDRYPP